MSKTSIDMGFKRASDKFVIATRTAGSKWPKAGVEADAIQVARGQYERGEVEMCQRREDGVDFLYSIPRRRKGIVRPGYFNTKLT